MIGPIDVTDSPHVRLRPVADARIDEGFWADRRRGPTARSCIPAGREQLEQAGNFDDLRAAAGLKDVAFRGMVFMDSDVYKWLEAIGWEPGVPQAGEEIALIEAAQEEDGYLNSYYQVATSRERFSNPAWDHELYCAGHLIHAAVAHVRGRGDERLLNVALRFVALLYERFGPQEQYDEAEQQEQGDRLRERAVVAREAAREVREVGVVAAPLAHPVEALEDPPRHPAPRIGVLVRAHGGARAGPEEREQRLLAQLPLDVGGQPGLGLGDPQRVALADRLAQLARLEHPGRERSGRGAQAVDARDLLGEDVGGELRQLLELDVRREREQQPARALPRAQREVGGGGGPARAGDLDERRDGGGDEQPLALARGLGVGAQPGSAGVAASSRPSWAAKPTSTGES